MWIIREIFVDNKGDICGYNVDNTITMLMQPCYQAIFSVTTEVEHKKAQIFRILLCDNLGY